MWNEALYEYIFLGVDSLIVGILYAAYRSNKEIISNIVKARSVTVGPEVEKLLEDHANNIEYIVLQGKVTPLGKPIKSQTGLEGVLQVVTLTEHSVKRHAFGQWGDEVRTLQKTFNSVPFALKNISGSRDGVIVEVKNPLDAERINLLNPVATNFSPANSNIGTAIVDFFTGHASKGFETTEKFLPVDTVVTGIGQLTRDSTGTIALSEPKQSDRFPYYLSTLPAESIVKRLERSNTWVKIGACVLATVGIIVAVRRINIWWKLRKQAKIRDLILKNRSKIDLEGLSDAQICIICLANPREILIMDCGHVAVCADCSARLSGKCPACNQVIRGTHVAYIA